MRLTVCALGPNVEGGAQRVDVALPRNATSDDLCRALSAQLSLTPPDAEVSNVLLHDERFDEFVVLDERLQMIQCQTIKVKIRCFGEESSKPEPVAETMSSPLSAAATHDLFMQLLSIVADTLDRAAGQGSYSAGITYAKRQLLRVCDDAILAAVRGAATPAEAIAAVREVATTIELQVTPQKHETKHMPVPKSPGRSRRMSDETTTTRRLSLDQLSNQPQATAVDYSGRTPNPRVQVQESQRRDGAQLHTTTCRASSATETTKPNISAYSSQSERPTIRSETTRRPSSDGTSRAAVKETVTLFCVFQGTDTQLAKAVKVNRFAPDFATLLATLETKFGCRITIGFTTAGGDVEEVHSEAQLIAQLKARLGDKQDQLSVRCWQTKPQTRPVSARATATTHAVHQSRPSTARSPHRLNMSEDPYSYAYRAPEVGNGRRPGGVLGPASPARSISGMSAASSASRLYSGAVYHTDKELREIFTELDVDGNGYVDPNEFREFYRLNFLDDDMGIVDAQEKFDRHLKNTRAWRDGKLDFDEFAVMMLRRAQWT